jgi:hypothetical protein
MTKSQLLDEEVHMTGGTEIESNTVKELRRRVAELEDMIKVIEHQNTTAEPSSSLQPDESDLPQYLVMAGVGICAIIGQSVIRRLFWS